MTNKAALMEGKQKSQGGAKAHEGVLEFREQQRYSGWQLIALILFLVLGLSYRFIDQHFIDPVPTPIGVLPYAALMALLLGALVYLLKVRVFIFANKEHICVSRFPWTRHPVCVKWSDVAACEIVRSPLLAQWSGSNIHLDHEKVFSVCGRNGIHLTTQEGEGLFIGSRRPDDLEDFIQKVL